MKIAVSFPIKNKVYVSNPFPITSDNRSYFIQTKDDVAVAVCVIWSGLPVAFAQTIESHETGEIKATIHGNQSDQYVHLAEYDLRAWQSLLCSYILIDIDFDNPTSTFSAENADEVDKIHVTSASTNRYQPRTRGKEAFETFGRAFLAIEQGKTHIEIMSHYREAMLALEVGRSIDAYNSFFLFLESQFCKGQSGTKQVVTLLSKQVDFTEALKEVCRDHKPNNHLYPIRFKSIGKVAIELKPLITEIVELRGALRHHSLGNPNRWNPNKQEDYSVEASFLGSVCFSVAFPKTTHLTWNQPYLEQFSSQAKQEKHIVEVMVTITVRIGETAEEKRFNMTFPQIGLDAHLATAVLQKVIEVVDKELPGSELFAIRAIHKTRGTELFRYDVGPTLYR